MAAKVKVARGVKVGVVVGLGDVTVGVPVGIGVMI